MSSSANHGPGADWYQNPDLLLGELKRGRSARGGLSGTSTGVVPAIPGYDELAELFRGGQGVVYKAIQRSTRRPVAIKLLLDGAFAAPDTRRRFEREIDLVAGLRHPNIVSVYDSGVTFDGRMYFVMEYIDGVPLDKWISDFGLRILDSKRPADGTEKAEKAASQSKIQNRKSKIETPLRLFVKICDAIQYAHQHGVIHRDLKPSNIRIDKEGEPRVLDFGLAKTARDERNGHSLTAISLTGQFMGSLPWSSPEQAEGMPDKIDVRTDVYALGVMLYEVLTGRFPYPVTGTFREVLDNILRAEPLRPRALAPALDADLETIALKCLSKEPERRYQSAGELSRDLRHYLAGEPIEAKRDSAWYAVRKTVRRYKLVAAVSLSFLLLAVGFGVTMAFLYRRAVSAEQLAGQRLDIAVREKQRADDQRVLAEQAAVKAQRVQKFLQETLISLDPEFARGQDVTVLKTLLDGAAARLKREFEQEPEIAAALHQTIGATYWSLGDYPAAERHLRAEADLKQRLLGDDNHDTLTAVNNLGLLLQNEGKYAEAEPHLRNAYERLRRMYGADHPDTLKAANNLATNLYYTGQPLKCEELYHEVLAAQRRTLGEDHPETLSTMNNLALSLGERGQWAEAEPMLRKIYETRRGALGDDHPATLRAAHNLARQLHDAGRAAEAEPLMRQTLETARRVQGERHPDVLNTMNSFALLLYDLGRSEEALNLLRETIKRTTEVSGPTHEDTLRSIFNLATMLHRLGRLNEAEPLYRDAIAHVRREYGDDHVSGQTAQTSLAVLLQERVEAEAAALTPAAKKALFDEAETLLRRVFERRRKLFGDEHALTLHTMTGLAKLLCERGAFAESDALYRSGYAIASRTLPPEHDVRVFLEIGCATALIHDGRMDEAEPLLLAIYERLQTKGTASERARAAARKRLVELYEAKNNPEQAAKYRK